MGAGVALQLHANFSTLNPGWCAWCGQAPRIRQPVKNLNPRQGGGGGWGAQTTAERSALHHAVAAASHLGLTSCTRYVSRLRDLGYQQPDPQAPSLPTPCRQGNKEHGCTRQPLHARHQTRPDPWGPTWKWKWETPGLVEVVMHSRLHARHGCFAATPNSIAGTHDGQRSAPA